jgi:hypothetical protein
MIGTHITVPQGTEIKADYLRGGQGFGAPSTLPAGQYIVDGYNVPDWCSEEEADMETELLLADARWDDRGRVSYHSGKHIYKVKRKNLIVRLDLLTAIKVEEKV